MRETVREKQDERNGEKTAYVRDGEATEKLGERENECFFFLFIYFRHIFCNMIYAPVIYT